MLCRRPQRQVFTGPIVFLMVVTVSVLWLFLIVPWVGAQCVIVIFPAHTHLLFFIFLMKGLWSALFKFIHLIDSNSNGPVIIYYFVSYFSMIRSIRRHLANAFWPFSPNLSEYILPLLPSSGGGYYLYMT